MPRTTEDDELQDLSIEDAEELRAFVDKRRWFEGKLEVSRPELTRPYMCEADVPPTGAQLLTRYIPLHSP
jgi:hypothetical protein